MKVYVCQKVIYPCKMGIIIVSANNIKEAKSVIEEYDSDNIYDLSCLYPSASLTTDLTIARVLYEQSYM